MLKTFNAFIKKIYKINDAEHVEITFDESGGGSIYRHEIALTIHDSKSFTRLGNAIARMTLYSSSGTPYNIGDMTNIFNTEPFYPITGWNNGEYGVDYFINNILYADGKFKFTLIRASDGETREEEVTAQDIVLTDNVYEV